MRARLLLLLAMIALAGLLISCGDAEEVAPTTTRPGAPTAASPKSASPTPAPTTSTAAPAPAGWKEYTDPQLGLSAAYPPDLVFKDLTGPSPRPGLNERVFDFRSASDSSRAFSISISSNTDNLTPREWALEFTACLPDTIEESTIIGERAVLCTAEATEVPTAGVVIAHLGKIYYIGSLLTDTEFRSMLASLRL